MYRYEIVIPVTPYDLCLGPVTISGEYAIVRGRRKDHALVLYLHNDVRTVRPVRPDIVSFARWLHLDLQESGGFDSHSVLHYWVNQEFTMEHNPDAAEARAFIVAAATTVDPAHRFPSPGPYCVSCPTQACRGGRPAREHPRGLETFWSMSRNSNQVPA